MHQNLAPVLISHDVALARIIAVTGADPSKADVLAEILRRRCPELLTLSQAAIRFAVSGRTLMNHYHAGRLRAVNTSSGKNRLRLSFYVADLVQLFDPDTAPAKARREAQDPVA